MDSKQLILVVDDERAILDVIELTLSSEGYDTYCTVDPCEALRYVTTHEVALLLTVVSMPGMSGLDLVDQASAHKPQLKILVMTGYSHTEVNRPVLHKPFRLADLVLHIRIALDEAQERWTQ